MHITRIELTNFGPFEGTHTVDLQPTVYGVAARHHDDSERSNWLGKSTFLVAIRFALHGKHTWDTEDGWITHDCDSGGIRMHLSDGMEIERTRKRGSATRLTVAPCGGAAVATQVQAQELIDRTIGLTHGQAANGPFVEQKQISRLVTAKAADRTKIINGWVDVDAIQQAHTHVSNELSDLTVADEQRANLQHGLMAIEPETVDDLDGVAERIAVLADETTELQAQIAALAEHQQRAHDADLFEQVCAEGQRLKGDAPPEPACDLVVLEQAANDAHELHTEARGVYQEARQLDSDGFDGQCPIMCGTCPVKERVADHVDGMASQVAVAEQEADRTQEAWQTAKVALTAAGDIEDAHDDHATTLTALRTQAAELAPAHEYIQKHGAPKDATALTARLQEVTTEGAALDARQRAAADVTTRNASRTAKIEQLTVERIALAAEMDTMREAMAVLGRNGIQRDIAQECMGTIEDLANGLLRDAGVALSIEIRWAREGKGLAKHCEFCGAPFPAGRGVKECTKCGGIRGPKMIEKVHFNLSNRSGAADDMGGLAFQLAAASWQRRSTHSAWGTVLIDEPFGALDRRHVKDMAAQLHGMIMGPQGFDQAFIVAHDASVMDAMPAQLTIVSDGQRARLES